MTSVCLHDKATIERVLRKNVHLHIYSIGDLDDFFWPYTTWYATRDNAGISAIALLYTGQSVPALLALSEKPDRMRSLLRSILHLLPHRFYAHLSPGVESVLRNFYHLDHYGEHLKMALFDQSQVAVGGCANACPLGRDDVNEIVEFYKQCYPENWFDPRMLETNQYFGIRIDDRLVSVAGIHVYSTEYKVAALGNIATSSARRNAGYARQVTAETCRSLLEGVHHIGLNVKADNDPAISCYRKLGFDIVASYDEYLVQRK
ncbi:MAG: GNAT family N-acetyltransferase [Desulfobacteraceae bacterium]|nr:GNAT family N-acetyltransferase [Desulfobacteraceae bacterium]